MSLKLTKRSGSECWYIRGTVAGREVFISSKTTSRTLADKERLKLEVEAHAEKESGPVRLFAEAAVSYLQCGGSPDGVDVVVKFLGAYALAEIRQDMIDEKAREAYPTQKNSTVKRWYYDVVGVIMNHAAGNGWCPYIKIRKPKVTRPPPKWAEMEWFEVFWGGCNDNLRALTTLLPYCGTRISEALGLVWERVNLEERWAYIPETKNREPRTIHLPDIVVDRLRVIKGAGEKEKRAGKVFPWTDRQAANWAIRRTVCRINEKRLEGGQLPIEYLSTHKIGSHTWATWMRRYAGLDTRGLVGTGRWKDMRSTMVYTHTTVKEEARKADLLPGATRAKSVQTRRKAAKTKG